MKRHAIEKLGVRRAFSGDIRVERLEERLVPKVPFPHTHDFYHILLIVSGSGTHEIDFQKYKVRPRQLFVMKPNQIHDWKLSPATVGFVLEFTDLSLVNPTLREKLRASQDQAIIKSHPDFKELSSTLALMESEFRKREASSDIALQGFLEAALVKILRYVLKTDRTSAANDIADRFRELLEKEYRSEHSVRFYARALGVTPKVLTMKLLRLVGKSPRALIQERCTLEAKRLLSHTAKAISEIGYSLGFDDPNYFARFFRSQTGMTAVQFRRGQR